MNNPTEPVRNMGSVLVCTTPRAVAEVFGASVPLVETAGVAPDFGCVMTKAVFVMTKVAPGEVQVPISASAWSGGAGTTVLSAGVVDGDSG